MVYKKQYVIDELPNVPKNAGGLYSILPYERLDDKGKALFKIGQADVFKKRFEQYHTYYPLGFYYKDLISNPNKAREEFYYKDANDRNKRKFSDKKYFNAIENYIMDDVKEHGGKQLTTTTRIKNHIRGRGQTEWFYAKPQTIHDAFQNAYKIYGGKEYDQDLDDINKLADRNEKKATYTAEIHYKIYAK